MSRQLVWVRGGTDPEAVGALYAELTARLDFGEDQARLIAFIGEHPAGVTPAEVAAFMGWDSRKTSTYLSRLVTAERIAKPSRGLYTPVGSVGSVGLDGDNETNNPTQPTPLTGAIRTKVAL